MDRFELKPSGMTTDPAGRWVTYNDHLLEMEYLREEVRKQVALVQALREEKGREFVLRTAQAARDGATAGVNLALLQLRKCKTCDGKGTVRTDQKGVFWIYCPDCKGRKEVEP